MQKTCTLEHCVRPHLAKGYCSMHYARLRTKGIAEVTGRLVGAPIEERLWAKTEVVGDCWVSHRCSRNGVEGERYRGIKVDGRMESVHIVSYRHFVGPIPEGHDIHHTCGTAPCWRPEHLMAVEHGEHQKLHAVTHCRRGHEFTSENTITRVQKGAPHKVCRTCKNEGNARYRERAAAKKAQAA